MMTLFDHVEPALPARTDDPVTSRAAARSVDMGARKREVIDAMRWLGVACTAHEIHTVVKRYGSQMDVGSVRSRLNQLKDDGKVRKTGGVKQVPKPEGTGRPEQTWALT